MPRVTITVNENQPQPYRFPLDREKVSMGRGSDNDIPILCPSVSVFHAVMERQSGGFRIKDLSSTNGTKLDGVRQDVIALHDGIVVEFGDVRFGFQLSEEEKEILAKEASAKPKGKKAQNFDDESSDSDEPARKPAKKPALKPAVAVGSPVQSAIMFLCFLLLAGIAFWIGLSMRHQKETGQSLMESMSPAKTMPTPAPESSFPADSVTPESEAP
jgi:pSer/pThr/pTyr-binding forkhead associated (FHA) protein